MPKKGYKSITVREDIYNEAVEMARERGISVSELIEKLVKGKVTTSEKKEHMIKASKIINGLTDWERERLYDIGYEMEMNVDDLILFALKRLAEDYIIHDCGTLAYRVRGTQGTVYYCPKCNVAIIGSKLTT